VVTAPDSDRVLVHTTVRITEARTRSAPIRLLR
jgi:hypothetical protein